LKIGRAVACLGGRCWLGVGRIPVDLDGRDPDRSRLAADELAAHAVHAHAIEPFGHSREQRDRLGVGGSQLKAPPMWLHVRPSPCGEAAARNSALV
jgi:hypothetical protein